VTYATSITIMNFYLTPWYTYLINTKVQLFIT